MVSTTSSLPAAVSGNSTVSLSLPSPSSTAAALDVSKPFTAHMVVPPLAIGSSSHPSSSSVSSSSNSQTAPLPSSLSVTGSVALPPLSGPPALSYAELLSRYQQTVQERDSLSVQLERLKDSTALLMAQPPNDFTSASIASFPSTLSSSSALPLPHSTAASSSSTLRLPQSAASTGHLPSASSTSSSLTVSAPPASLQSLRAQHSLIQTSISSIQHRTARILHDQERELIRAFRLRLSEVTVELSEERKRSESGSAEWVQRCRKLSEELEWLKALTEKLTGDNRELQKEAKRTRKTMKTMEEDRDFLIQQLVACKKETARLRQQSDKNHSTAAAAANGDSEWMALAREEKVAMG